MLVGIGIEQYKAHFARKNAAVEHQKTEISKINIAISALGYNFESLCLIAMQYIIPHYQQLHKFYKEIRELQNDDEAMRKLRAVPFSSRYPAISTTCLEPFLIEHDFMRELPFVMERDAELLKDSSWLISQARELGAIIRSRNDTIHAAWQVTTEMNGLSNFYFEQILQKQMSISETECLLASQILDLTTKTVKKLETINDTYTVSAKKSQVKLTGVAETTMATLRTLSNRSVSDQPAEGTPGALG